MARVEATGVTAHRHQAGLLLLLHHRLGVAQAVGQWDFHLDVLARLQARERLRRVQLGRCAEDDGIHIAPRERFLEVRRHMLDAEARADRLRFLQNPPHQGYDPHAIYVRKAI